MMWASMIVVSESCMPICVNSISAETPATISGVTSGISISTLALPAQRVRARTSPNASAVPSTVATTIVTNAIWMLAISDSRSDSFSKKRSYQRRLKPSKFCSELVELNENRIDQRDRREQEHEEERR